MKVESKLSSKIEGKDFIVTAECAPPAGTGASVLDACSKVMKDKVTAVNVADNHFGVALSSLAAAVALLKNGVEPVYQLVTRDRNRIALQSDLLGAAYLGIKNVLCLSGYHQALIGVPQSAGVYDIDSIQLVALVKKMNGGALLDGAKIDGAFGMLIGAVANPYLKPLELNMLRLSKKIAAGADFIQTHAVFDVDGFTAWMEAAAKEGLTEKVAIIAGVMPLAGADEAKRLSETFTDYIIPTPIIERLRSAGDAAAQRKEGVAVCAETIKKLKSVKGLRGVHILCGGNEAALPDVLAAAAL